MRIDEKIFKTLIYADIFNFPLSKSELWRFLISDKTVDKKSFNEIINKKSSSFSTYKDWYFLNKRKSLVNLRLKRMRESRKKLTEAKKIAFYLSFIPTVYFIGISGNLSMQNASEEDDIDLFIIAKKDTIFLTRAVILLILQVLGIRRKRDEKQQANKICLNMLIDETAIKLSKERRDLYTAHEIVQMKPLFERNNIYEKFMSLNKWVLEFMPNSVDIKKLSNEDIKDTMGLLNYPISQLLTIFEFLAKTIQLWYMRKHRTNETITDRMLAFHPLDYKELILKEYEARKQKI